MAGGRSDPGGRAAESYAHWSRLHGGLDPTSSAWVAGWVRLVHALARPLVRRGVGPDTVTVVGLAVVVPAPFVAALGGAWPLATAALVALGAVLDGVDGAVAARRGGGTAWGRVLDPFADRCADLLLVALLVVVGAPLGVGIALAALVLLHESVRHSAQAAGMAGPGVVSVGERPTRVIAAGLAAGLAGLEHLAREAGVDLLPGIGPAELASAAASAALALTAVGLVQLLVAVRRRLAQAGPTRSATIRDESTTSGSPPPGWDEPPTR